MNEFNTVDLSAASAAELEQIEGGFGFLAALAFAGVGAGAWVAGSALGDALVEHVNGGNLGSALKNIAKTAGPK